MTYKLFYSSQSEKQLKKLEKQAKLQIIKKIFELEKNPNIGKPLRNVFKNYRSLHIGKYRVIYSIKGKDVIIAKIGHRDKVYD